MQAIVESVYYELTTPGMRERITFIVENIIDAPGDSTMIRQVWVNLISNAIKFSSQNEHAHIHITSAIEGNNCVYCIKDDGVGFDMKYLEKLFDVFQRLHSVQNFEGTGVGLAIVQRIVSRHGGVVKAEGEIDIGASFYFSLPLIVND